LAETLVCGRGIYKNGYCWFALTAHEEMAYLYTDNDRDAETLRNLGLEVTYTEDNAQVFYYDLTKEMNHYRTKRPNQ